ncbi:RNA polymerase sigma factor [Spongisporangium articulatum]|uniref:RNA polymerase sigma factor n=1 Tax=Spongisporangium articulatum TaxID=3362603 RepID=A0ABW8AK20_9ACTN
MNRRPRDAGPAAVPDAVLDTLVQDAQLGSGMAFTRIWELLSPTVAGYVRGRGVHDVDDVTSEVFLAAFRSLDGFTGDAVAFRRWLFTIAHRRAVDAVRQQIRTGVEEPYDADADPRTVGSAESDALHRLDHAEALRLVQELPDDQRDVLLLRIVSELSVEEVAEVLDRSTDAVRQLHRRAVARVRSLAALAAAHPTSRRAPRPRIIGARPVSAGGLE